MDPYATNPRTEVEARLARLKREYQQREKKWRRGVFTPKNPESDRRLALLLAALREVHYRLDALAAGAGFKVTHLCPKWNVYSWTVTLRPGTRIRAAVRRTTPRRIAVRRHRRAARRLQKTGTDPASPADPPPAQLTLAAACAVLAGFAARALAAMALQ